jgi:hypothetical protein
MQAQMTDIASNGALDGVRLDALWSHIQQHLEAEKTRIFQEIRHYPPPIPACDVQFNRLLEERVTILQALDWVNSIHKKELTISEQLESLNAFINSSHHLSREVVENIRQSLA